MTDDPPDSDGRDAALVAAIAAGDGEAAAELVERHWRELFRVADLILRDVHAAEDVAQDALISAFTSLDGFDPSRELRPWLVGIASNKAIDRARKAKRRQQVDPALLEKTVESHDRVGAERPDLRAALEALDPEARAILVMRHVLGYRSAEISELLGVAPGTVRSRLKRSLDSLRNTLMTEAP